MTAGTPRPTRNPRVTSKTLGDDYVVVEPTTLMAHALEGLAAAVWAWADDGPSPDAPADELAAVLTQLTALGLLAPTGRSLRTRRTPRARLFVPGLGITSIELPSPCAAMSPGFEYTARRTDGPGTDATEG